MNPENWLKLTLKLLGRNVKAELLKQIEDMTSDDPKLVEVYLILNQFSINKLRMRDLIFAVLGIAGTTLFSLLLTVLGSGLH